MELRPKVFVAMSFAEEYKKRFEMVIEPAIRAIEVDGRTLEPHRVDLTKTGDSILTDIVNGIAHSQLFLADVSSVGKDSKSSHAYRNGNVMYEVGIALACRHSSEVLLVRDDCDKFLFDVSTIPHKNIDFTESKVAKHELENALRERLKEQLYIRNARVQIAAASLSSEEFDELKFSASLPSGTSWGRHHRPYPGPHELAISRLLDKQIVRMAGRFDNGNPAYVLTQLGEIVAKLATTTVPVVEDLVPATKQRK
jgi:hypothetical protein